MNDTSMYFLKKLRKYGVEIEPPLEVNVPELKRTGMVAQKRVETFLAGNWVVVDGYTITAKGLEELEKMEYNYRK